MLKFLKVMEGLPTKMQGGMSMVSDTPLVWGLVKDTDTGATYLWPVELSHLTEEQLHNGQGIGSVFEYRVADALFVDPRSK